MPKLIATQYYVAINGTALSGFATHVDIDDTADEIDATGFSTAGYKQIIPGLKDATINVTFMSNFGTIVGDQVNAIIQPLYQTGGTCLVELRPTQGAVTALNPKATMTAGVFSYNGITGDVGDLATFDCAFRNAGTAGLVWGTS